MIIRDSANIDRIIVCIDYDKNIVLEKEQQEISNLYIRMLFGLVFSMAILFWICHTGIKRLSGSMKAIESVIEQWEHRGPDQINLSQVNEPTLKILLRSATHNINFIKKNFEKIENLSEMSDINKEEVE